jgi:hypothetical protein
MTNLRANLCCFMWMLAAALISGCSLGHLAPKRQLEPFDLARPTAPDLPKLQPGATPRPAVARTCRVSDPASFAAIRPGVGARLDLAFWSGGILPDQNPGRANQAPPQVDYLPLALRMIAPGARLDATEQRVLSTFLITNRAAWHRVGTPTSAERLQLAAALREHQALLWNALTTSLCVEVRDIEPPTDASAPRKGRTLAVVADMAAICRALPETHQGIFAKAYVTPPSNPNCKDKAYRHVAGLTDEQIGGDWIAGAIDTAPYGNGSGTYYGVGTQSSIIVTGGAVALDSVRPDRADAPNWSLAEWEASRICRVAPDELTRIVSLRLIGASRAIDVLDDGDTRPVTHRIEHDGIAAYLVKKRDDWPFAAIPRADLAWLRIADVRQLQWAVIAPGGAVRTVQPDGCVNFR